MSELHLIGNARSRPIAGSLVFVHGLGGDAFKTWRHKDDEKAFWPHWLAEDIDNINVYSLAYEAEPIAWLGHTMPLLDRAKNVLTWFETISDAPIIFVCHSLGGLVIKKVIELAASSRNPRWTPILQQTKGIIFLATPHAGAGLGDFIEKLGLILRTNVSVKELQRNAPELRGLNEWYRNNANALGIKTLAFYETLPMYQVIVVDPTSGDPSIQGSSAIPLDATHSSICKLETRSQLLYGAIVRFIAECFREADEAAVRPNGTTRPTIENAALVAQRPVTGESAASYRDRWLLSIKNYPAVRPHDIPLDVIEVFAKAFPIPAGARLFIRSVSALRLKLNPEANTEKQIALLEEELPMAAANPIDFWSEVLSLAGGKSRRTLAAFIVCPNAPIAERYGPEAAQEFESFKAFLTA